MPDYGNMTLREELEARFREKEQQEREAEFLARGWQPPAGYGTEDAVWTEQRAPSLTPGQRAWNSLKHDFEDMGYGIKKGLSGATLGASDWVLRKLGITDDDYLARREAEGLGGAVKAAGFGAELGGNMLGAGGALIKRLGNLGLKGLKLASTAGGIEGGITGGFNSDTLGELPANVISGGVLGAALPFGLHGTAMGTKWAVRPITNRVTRYLNKRKLAKQLGKSDGFEDVNLGNIDDDLATQLNQIRNAENVSPVDNANVTVPANNVSHLWKRRIGKNGYSPEETSETINNALFSRNSRVVKGKSPEFQVILDGNNPPNAAIVGKNADTNGIMIKTGYRADNADNISESYLRGNLAGTGNPTSTPIQQNRSAASISALQIPSEVNVTPNSEIVNPAFSRSFIEALADEGKRRAIRNAVMSGAEDLSERAKILSDKMAARKNGTYDAGKSYKNSGIGKSGNEL